MKTFEEYRRKQVAELRPVDAYDIDEFKDKGNIFAHDAGAGDDMIKVSISDPDLENGSPKIGDMIARNPKNHEDQWLVARQYFEDNFEPVR